MRNPILRALCCAPIALCLVACSDDSSSSDDETDVGADTMQGDTMESDAGTDASAADPVTVRTQVNGIGIADNSGLPELEVCVLDGDDCATTDADGYFELEVPGNSDVGFLVNGGDTWISTLMLYRTATEDVELRLNIPGTAVLELFTLLVGEPINYDTQGSVNINARAAIDDYENDVAGVQFTIAPEGGTGVIYSSPGGPDTNATETGTEGSADVFNLDPGEYTMTGDFGGTACQPWFGWSSDTPDAMTVRVVAGYATQVSMVCAQ